MRGEERQQRSMLLVVNLEERIPREHPLRRIKQLAQAALAQLSPVFAQMYRALGRPSIPPERLLKASLLMALYSVRSERLFCEQLDYNLLFRWFLDLEMDEASFDHSTFSRNRARLLEHQVAGEFFRAVVEQARRLRLLSDEHFTVDGTLIEAWASLKSFKRKDTGPRQPPDDPGNPTVNFTANAAPTRPISRPPIQRPRWRRRVVARRAKLCYSANALMENRSNLLLDIQVESADGTAERRAIAMADERLPGGRRITLGGYKGHDTRDFVASCRALRITPHVAQNHARRGGSALDARTVRHPGYVLSQWVRNQVEEAFGWMKTVGGLRQTRYRGRARVQMHAYLVTAYNLIRLARLSPAAA